MSFPRYPKYKDSGVEWLGQVPEHWEMKPLKAVATLCGRIGYRGYTTADIVDEGEGAITLSPSNMASGVVSFANSTFISWSKFNESPEIQIASSDIIMVKTGSTIGKVAQVRTIEHPATINPQLVIYKKITCIPRFLFFVLNTPVIQALVVVNNSGSTIPTMSQEAIGNFKFTLPSKLEQEAIASFLDRETAKIDALVAEQQRLIELLKEKRQAVISHAVTKGLNPNAPMKPSGIEWLGDVPEHWDVKPLKYLINLKSGGTPSKENLKYWDGDVPWASSKDLKCEDLFDTQDHISQLALDDGIAALVAAGSILTVVRGMILLHTFPVVTVRVPMAINQDLKAITPRAHLGSEYLVWLLRGASTAILNRTDEAAHGTKVLRIDSWLAMQVPVPRQEEQICIVSFIREQLASLDTLTTEAHRAIDLLQERRTALISAAVTGQIDVRHASA